MDLQSDISWLSGIPKSSNELVPRQFIHIDAVACHPVFHRDLVSFEPWVIVCTVKKDHPKWKNVQSFINSLLDGQEISQKDIVVDCDNYSGTEITDREIYSVSLTGEKSSLVFKNRNAVERWVFDMIANDVLKRVKGLVVYCLSVKNVPACWLASSPIGFCSVTVDDPNEILLKGLGSPFDAIDNSSVKKDDVVGWIKHIENSRITKF